MKMSQEEYRALILKHPNLKPSEDHSKNTRKVAKLESNPSNAPLEQKKLQRASEAAIVRITSVRRTLLDTDNICQKFLVDLLRYANILYDDNPQQTTIQTTQRKCEKGEEEHTLVEIEIK